MKFLYRYGKSRCRALLLALVFCAVFVGSFLLYHLPLQAMVYPALLCLGIALTVGIVDCLRIRCKHTALTRIRTVADVQSELLPLPDTVCEEDYAEILQLLREEQLYSHARLDEKYGNMVAYYTVWVHQIKTPIASMHLHLQNEDSALSRQLTSDLHRIEQYVEMVLTFLRLDSETTDYVFRACDLDTVVCSAVKKFSSDFIERKLKLVYEPLNRTVVTDEKWLSFVVEQVLSNALKYTPSGEITVTVEGEATLRIRDTGIGIAPEDLPRIFENGYTGCNGRSDRKASGIGLYLCRRICFELGHRMTVSSVLHEGTTVDIDLSQRRTEAE